MKIGLFSDAYLPEISGVTSVVSWLRRELERNGHEVHIYVPAYTEPQERESRVYRFHSRRFIFHKASRVALPYNRRATRTFKRLDIIHSHTPFSLGLVALGASARYRIPHIHTYHTHLVAYRHYLPFPLRPPKRTTAELAAWFCNRCTAVTVPSNPMREELLGYGVKRPIHVLPFGVDQELFHRPPVWDPRESLGIDPSVRLYLYAGRLAAEKNLDFLLRAYKRIHAVDRDSVLVLAGDGPRRLALERLVHEEGLEKAVVFTGFLDHPRLVDLYKAADLFIFASKTETEGLVLVEAMAGGTPPVAIGEMGVLDVVEDGVSGLLVPEDEEKFAQTVLSLMDDPARYRKLQEGALKRAKELSVQNATQKLIEIYAQYAKK
ncbi:glycosyltransferase family 4 protein [Candidatus Acetothermia bacterium]|nr:MAG: glycosyltransferase family 4 protein [Candidatus Acetothermia bacterium]